MVFLDRGAINEELTVCLATTTNHKLKPFEPEELRSVVRRVLADGARPSNVVALESTSTDNTTVEYRPARAAMPQRGVM